jgi:hypothetical protein
MIQLHHDYLLFQTSAGESIPCSAQQVTLELIGEYASVINPILLQQAAAAVLHHFKHDLGREQVTIAEFSAALERILKHFGFAVSSDAEVCVSPIEASDLRDLVSATDKSFELAFFALLRAELQAKLTTTPRMIAFNGLRGCVKQLLGAKRWSPRCQTLNDQIVEYLRNCLSTDERGASCGLVIR